MICEEESIEIINYSPPLRNMCRCEGYGFQAVYSGIEYKSESLSLE